VLLILFLAQLVGSTVLPASWQGPARLTLGATYALAAAWTLVRRRAQVVELARDAFVRPLNDC
jgi:hypothetical protein